MEEAKAEKEMCERVKKFVKKVQSSAIKAASASNDLPKTGGDFEVYNTNAAFAQLMSAEKTRANELISSLLLQAGIAKRQVRRLMQGDLNDQLEALTAVNDKLFERVANSIDEANGTRKKEHSVVVPGTQRPLNSSTWLAYKEKVLEAAAVDKEDDVVPTAASASHPMMPVVQNHRDTITHCDMTLPRPQDVYKLGQYIDNGDTVFKQDKLVLKHHALPVDTVKAGVTIVDDEIDDDDDEGDAQREWASDRLTDGYEHPYAHELAKFRPLPKQMKKKTPIASVAIDTPVMVDTEKALHELIAVLNEEQVFAVDLEHHSERSYLGLTCLIQISIRKRDFIVDPFPIWAHMHLLNEPMTNPNIVKVFHGADSDVLWLQRDFGVYIVNLFDTYRAMRQLNYPKLSLRYLVDSMCHVDLDKGQTQSDWRRRPLSSDQISYAQLDTHYLLFCYDRLRNDLLDMTDGHQALEDVYVRSKQVAASMYTKPNHPFNAYACVEGMLAHAKSTVHSLGAREHYAARMLTQWRDTVARERDEGSHYVLPNRMLVDLANLLPREQSGIGTCCAPMPILLAENITAVHTIIIRARDASEDHLAALADADRHLADQQRRVRHMPSSRARALAWLYTPHDFSHRKREDELMKKKSAGVDDVIVPPLATRAQLSSAFGGDDEPPVKKGKKRVIKTTTTIVLQTYNEQSKDVLKSKNDFRTKFDEMQARTCTPFEQYQLAIMQMEEMNAKKKTVKGTEKKADDGVKRFSHHDPSTGTGTKVIGGVIDTQEEDHVVSTKFQYDADELLTDKAKAHQKRAADAFSATDPHQVSMKTKASKRKMEKKTSSNKVTPFDYEAFKKQKPGSSNAQGDEEIFDPDRNRPTKKRKFRKPHKGKGKSAIF